MREIIFDDWFPFSKILEIAGGAIAQSEWVSSAFILKIITESGHEKLLVQ